MACCVSCYTGGREVRYDDLVDSLNTGDGLLCKGEGGCFSCSIQMCTNSPFSHTGMVVRSERFQADPDDAYIWHSDGPSGLRDLITGKTRKSGPQINSLREYVTYYNGVVVVRQLTSARGIPRDLSDRLYKWMVSQSHTTYEKNPMELLGTLNAFSFFLCCKNNRSDTTSYFCSELLAETYMTMGLLNRNEPSNTYTPSWFSSSGEQYLNAQVSF